MWVYSVYLVYRLLVCFISYRFNFCPTRTALLAGDLLHHIMLFASFIFIQHRSPRYFIVIFVLTLWLRSSSSSHLCHHLHRHRHHHEIVHQLCCFITSVANTFINYNIAVITIITDIIAVIMDFSIVFIISIAIIVSIINPAWPRRGCWIGLRYLFWALCRVIWWSFLCPLFDDWLLLVLYDCIFVNSFDRECGSPLGEFNTLLWRVNLVYYCIAFCLYRV